MRRQKIVHSCLGISFFSLLIICYASLVVNAAAGNHLDVDPLRPRFLYSPPSNSCGLPGREFVCPPHYVCVSPEGFPEYRICLSQAVSWENPNEEVHRLVACCVDKRIDCPVCEMCPAMTTIIPAVPTSSEVAWIDKVSITQNEFSAKINTTVLVPGSSSSEGCSQLQILTAVCSSFAATFLTVHLLAFGILVFRAHRSRSLVPEHSDGQIRDASNLQSFHNNNIRTRRSRGQNNSNCFRFCHRRRHQAMPIPNNSVLMTSSLYEQTPTIEPLSSPTSRSIIPNESIPSGSYFGCADPRIHSKSQDRTNSLNDGASNSVLDTVLPFPMSMESPNQASTSNANKEIKHRISVWMVGLPNSYKSNSEKRSSFTSGHTRWSDRKLKFLGTPPDHSVSESENNVTRDNQNKEKSKLEKSAKRKAKKNGVDGSLDDL